MIRVFFRFLLLFSSVLFADTNQKLEFEVASVKPAQPMPMGQMRIQMNSDGGMLRYSNVSLKDCIRVAYRVKEFQIDGPDWLASTRFDIQAKLPDGSSKDQIPEMLQSLLVERFKLAVHRSTKDHAVYALVTAKDGPKLKAAEIAVSPAGDGKALPPPGEKPTPAMEGKAFATAGTVPKGAMLMQFGPSGMHMRAASATLATLAEMLSRFCDRPVLDTTGIQGQYDFDLSFMPDTAVGLPGPRTGGPMTQPMAGGEGSRGPVIGAMGDHGPAEAPAEPAGSIFDAVQRYGLKLEPKKAPMEIVSVDHIEKAPTEN